MEKEAAIVCDVSVVLNEHNAMPIVRPRKESSLEGVRLCFLDTLVSLGVCTERHALSEEGRRPVIAVETDATLIKNCFLLITA